MNKLKAISTLFTTSILFSSSAMANPTSFTSKCEQAGSTGLTYQCFKKELEILDMKLKELLNSVPAMAADVPSQQFRDLWMEHLENEEIDRSNVTQLINFQQARHTYCSYINSMAFQGTGYGSIVLKCEMELTQAALKNEP